MEHYKNRKSENEPAILSDELNQEIIISNKELSLLSERIADDGLREKIKLLRAKMTEVLVAKSPEESKARIKTLSYSFDENMAALGTVLRSIL